MRNAKTIVSIAALLTLAGCAAQTAQQAEPRAFVVYFETGSARLTPEAQQIVAEIADAAKQSRHLDITVNGAADGTDGRDAALAGRRAAAVEAALRADGVADTVVSVHGTTPSETGVAAHRVTVTLVARE
jgi:outer membrane protein OmpA-like peptidoglycan-associated protein